MKKATTPRLKIPADPYWRLTVRVKIAKIKMEIPILPVYTSKIGLNISHFSCPFEKGSKIWARTGKPAWKVKHDYHDDNVCNRHIIVYWLTHCNQLWDAEVLCKTQHKSRSDHPIEAS